MTTEIQMPQLGESVTEGTLAKWLKQPGETVSQYEPICEVETDKVTTEIPSMVEGVMQEHIVQEGETVSVGALICRILTKDEQKSSSKKVVKTMKKRYSPAVLRLAQEHDLDLTKIEGTGRGGRITRKDVLAYLEKQKTEPMETEQKTETLAPITTGRDQEIPLSHFRRTIAERMSLAKKEIPHAWLMMEADVTGLVQLRQKLKKPFLEEGIHLTYLPFFVKAVVDSLKEYPYLNSMWAGDKIILKKDIHISLAVATEEALFVPVIHHADEKSILGLARTIQELVAKTRAGKLEPKDVEGGTFTVNNTGSFGSIASQPIINYPQVGILSFEAIVKRPVVVQDMIGIRDRINLCLSLDHRVLDGLMAGRFLRSVKERLEAYHPNQTIY